MKKGGVTRREFLKRMGILGGGIIVYIAVGDHSGLVQPSRSAVPADFNAFLRIGVDGTVTCFTGKIEMGQGINTSLAQMLADELDVPFDAIEMVMGDTDLCPWDRGTWGSMTTRFFGPILREAAAEARAVLMELAAEYLKVPVQQWMVKDGVIFDKGQTGNRVTYAQLTQGNIIERHVEVKPPLKPASEFTLVGKPFPREDARDKVTGKAVYAGDIRLPSMLYARILRPPAHGAKLKSLDTSAAKQMKGVLVVQDGELCAVLHEHPDEAEKALSRIKAEFDVPKTPLNEENIFDHLLKVAPEGSIVSRGGILESGNKLAREIFKETYLNSYVAHAPIETHTAVAKLEKGKIMVWASTQSPFGVKEQIASSLGIPSQNVRVIAPFLGGRVRRKELQHASLGGSAIGKIDGKAGARRVEPCRGVLL